MKNLFLGIPDRPLFSLFSAVYPEEKAEALASLLTDRYGSLSGILKINPDVLAADIGREAALYLRISLSFAIRAITDRLKVGNQITEAVLVRHFSALYTDTTEETVYAVLLDKESRLLSVHRIAVGSADASSFQPRQILELAVRTSASGVILTHNHPGGTLAPSASDRKITAAVAAALEAARIRFLGHYIFADTGFARIDKDESDAANASHTLKP